MSISGHSSRTKALPYHGYDRAGRRIFTAMTWMGLTAPLLAKSQQNITWSYNTVALLRNGPQYTACRRRHYKLKEKAALGWRYQSRTLAFQDTQTRRVLVKGLEIIYPIDPAINVIVEVTTLSTFRCFVRSCGSGTQLQE